MISEKELLTQKRKQQLLTHPDYKDLEKFGQYCYIPLDIPVFKDDKFADWFFEKCKPVTKRMPDLSSENPTLSMFDGFDVVPEGSIEDNIWDSPTYNNFITEFPNLYEQICEYLPFSYIGRIRFWSSHNQVMFHRDDNNLCDYPGNFRIMIHNNNPTSTFNLMESSPEIKIKKIFKVPKLAETNAFAYNNLRVQHGTYFFQNTQRKILLILDSYILNVKRCMDLFERSISKYEKYLMVSQRPLSEFVNL